MPAMEASSRRVLGILSDCDGVIVDSEVIADAILVEVMQAALGRGDLGDFTQDMFGRRLIDIIRLMEERIGHAFTSAERIALQQRIDAEVAEQAPAVPGTTDVYGRLGLPLAVVSNSAFPRLQRSVERAGLLPLAGMHLYSAEDVGRPKPAPDAYLHAARQLGLHPRNCLVIEDSLTGVRAGRAAGMRVLGFLGGSHIGAGHAARLAEAGAMDVFADMRELPGLIAVAEQSSGDLRRSA
ncbi:HAD family hydrolase [Variovorax ginsengisoli]|uniref:HAD superfamily hydrolase (TIGR01509 family) n=1 Tax=Variovorax ginsengisoli TaxID=363844 RepID=A0ABT9S398_9BURK|nr:HAD-IA family hydrolase [Variovorax ginsengisoli]MDP9898825.1 HAD superfamily hydrolase (TIGR01509 family) [Variovorax ginsengisoli]